MTVQKWVGVYSYDAESIDEIPENSPACELYLETDAEGGITGHLRDSTYQSLTEAPVVLRGFVEENFISLVAHYPFKLGRLENGNLHLDTEKIDQEVPIYGELSEDGSEMTGSMERFESFIEQGALSDIFKLGFFKVGRVDS